jgi:hypothetical protein
MALRHPLKFGGLTRCEAPRSGVGGAKLDALGGLQPGGPRQSSIAWDIEVASPRRKIAL